MNSQSKIKKTLPLIALLGVGGVFRIEGVSNPNRSIDVLHVRQTPTVSNALFDFDAIEEAEARQLAASAQENGPGVPPSEAPTNESATSNLLGSPQASVLEAAIPQLDAAAEGVVGAASELISDSSSEIGLPVMRRTQSCPAFFENKKPEPGLEAAVYNAARVELIDRRNAASNFRAQRQDNGGGVLPFLDQPDTTDQTGARTRGVPPQAVPPSDGEIDADIFHWYQTQNPGFELYGRIEPAVEPQAVLPEELIIMIEEAKNELNEQHEVLRDTQEQRGYEHQAIPEQTLAEVANQAIQQTIIAGKQAEIAEEARAQIVREVPTAEKALELAKQRLQRRQRGCLVQASKEAVDLVQKIKQKAETALEAALIAKEAAIAAKQAAEAITREVEVEATEEVKEIVIQAAEEAEKEEKNAFEAAEAAFKLAKQIILKLREVAALVGQANGPGVPPPAVPPSYAPSDASVPEFGLENSGFELCDRIEDVVEELVGAAPVSPTKDDIQSIEAWSRPVAMKPIVGKTFVETLLNKPVVTKAIKALDKAKDKAKIKLSTIWIPKDLQRGPNGQAPVKKQVKTTPNN